MEQNYTILKQNYIAYLRECRDNLDVVLRDFAAEVYNFLKETYNDEYMKCYINYCKNNMVVKFSFRHLKRKPKNENIITITEKPMKRCGQKVFFGKDTISIYRKLQPDTISICAAVYLCIEIKEAILRAEIERYNEMA